MKKIEEFYNSKNGQSIMVLLRSALFLVLGYVIDGLINIFTTTDQTTTVVAVTIFLKLVDEILHKSGLAEKGISRF